MTFEIQLLVFAVLLPLVVSIVGTVILSRLQQNVANKALWAFVLLMMVIWVMGLLVSSSRVSLLEYVEADHYRKLPWFALLSALLGLVCVRRDDLSREDASKDRRLQDSWFWIARCTLLCVAAWWLIPKGKGWEDTSDWQPIWLLMAGLGATWNWWCLSAVRQRWSGALDADKKDAQPEKEIGWQLWIGIGALLGVAGLAGMSLASLAESLATIAAIAIGVSLIGHFRTDKVLTRLSESGVAAAISGGTVLSMAYPSSSVPKFVYITMMLVPVIVTLVDGLMRWLGLKPTGRFVGCFVVTAGLVGGLLGWVLLHEPAEEW